VIIDQNAGHDCTEAESAVFVGVGYNGPYRVEISSSIKYGFLSRPSAGRIAVTDRAQKAIRVIYYNVSDPFWGEKLIEKVAENILSALSNPEEAVFKRALNR
jgi:hypothetical protein